MKDNKKFNTVASFVENSHLLTEEEYATGLSKFSSIEKQNITATEYIAYWAYPAGRFKKDDIKSIIKAFGQTYYPIVGWNPDTISPFAGEEVKESAIRKQLKRLKCRKLHNPRENKTYILYG